MNFEFYNVIGGIGVGLIIVSYFLLQGSKLESSSILYSILNAAGALFVLFSLYFNFNLPAFVVEFFWLAISLYGIGRYIFARKTNGSQSTKNTTFLH